MVDSETLILNSLTRILVFTLKVQRILNDGSIAPIMSRLSKQPNVSYPMIGTSIFMSIMKKPTMQTMNHITSIGNAHFISSRK